MNKFLKKLQFWKWFRRVKKLDSIEELIAINEKEILVEVVEEDKPRLPFTAFHALYFFFFSYMSLLLGYKNLNEGLVIGGSFITIGLLHLFVTWRLEMRNWRNKNLSGIPSEEMVEVKMRKLIERARERVLGDNSNIAGALSKIDFQMNGLATQQGYFEERIRQGEKEIAEKALDEISLSKAKLELYRTHVQNIEAGFVRAFAACEARVPRVVGVVKDKLMLSELSTLTLSIDVTGNQVAELIPKTFQLIADEFGRINTMLTGVTEKAIALPLLDLSGDDIKVVMGRLVLDEQRLDHELLDLEATLNGENIAA